MQTRTRSAPRRPPRGTPSPAAREDHAAGRHRRPTRRRLAVRLAVSATTLALCLVTVEAALRCMPSPFSSLRTVIRVVDDPRGYELRPGTSLTFGGMLEPIEPPVTWIVNAHGMRRAAPVAGPHPRGVTRVATYGDSEVFGWGVAEERTFQGLLEQARPDLEVLNLGVPGYDATCVAAHVETTAPALAPDLLLYVVNPNDFEPPLPYVSRWTERSETVRWSAYVAYRILAEEDAGEQRRSAERIAAVTASLHRICDVAREIDAVCWIAFLDPADHELLLRDEALARRVAADPELRMLDVQPSPPARVEVDEHLTAAAHEEIAARLADELRDVVSGR